MVPKVQFLDQRHGTSITRKPVRHENYWAPPSPTKLGTGAGASNPRSNKSPKIFQLILKFENH